MPEKDNREFAKNVLAAINAHDIEKYLENIDVSYVGESENAPEPIHGHAGARQTMEMMFKAFPDVHAEIEATIASGDHLVVQVRLTATHKGTFAGFPATNKKATWHICNVLQLKNGRAVRSRIYADNASLMRQLGVLPAPKATTAG